MRGRSSVEFEAPGKDSFLDVVANVVAILIILVMVVGSQAKQGLVAAARRATNSASPPSLDVAGAESAARTAEIAVNELQARINRQQFEIAYRDAERGQLQKLVLLAEQEVAERREKMSDEQKAQ